jgi:hypothetical protein
MDAVIAALVWLGLFALALANYEVLPRLHW